MNKAELITALTEKAEVSKKSAETSLNALVDIITSELQNKGKVQLIGFGTFETRKRAARKGVNPQTKQEIKIPASTVPVFKAGKAFKEAINK